MDVRELTDKHKGEIAWIIGRGPSLKGLKKEHIGPGPVIALNQTIVQIEEMGLDNPIYSQQKDGCGDLTPGHVCKREMVRPKGAALLVHSPESPCCMDDYGPRYVFCNPIDYDGIHIHAPSGASALGLAKLMGCTKAVLVSFDACTSGNIQPYLPDEWGCGKGPDINLDYLKHKEIMDNWIAYVGIEVEWFTPPEEEEKMKLVIATPFYEMKGWSPYIRSLMGSVVTLARATTLDFDFWPLDGDSYVYRARNTLANKLMRSEFTDILYIDSDMSWDLEGLLWIISSKKDVIGAAYPVKNNWEQYGITIYTNDEGIPVTNERGEIKAWGVPSGFMKVKKRAYQALAAADPDNFYWTGEGETEKHYNFYGHFIRDHRAYGEDIAFCRRWADIGGSLWVEPRVTIDHWGVKRWSGNYHEFLLRCPGGSKEGEKAYEEES